MADGIHSSTAVQVPAAADLDTWSGLAWQDGVQVDRLLPLEQLVVRTRNNTYEITVVSPHEGKIIVRGGQFFPAPTRARLAGASLGGSFLKLRGIYVGFRMELAHAGTTIITSPVHTISQPASGRVQ